MAEILCEVSDGLRPAEAHVVFWDYYGRRQSLPMHRDVLSQEGDRYFLPVGLIWIDKRQKAALVALPDEADSGANRVWVKLKDPAAASFDTASFIDRPTHPHDCSDGIVIAPKQLGLGWMIDLEHRPARDQADQGHAHLPAHLRGSAWHSRTGVFGPVPHPGTQCSPGSARNADAAA